MFEALPAVITLYLIVVGLQVTAACLAERFTGAYRWHESVMIGLQMTVVEYRRSLLRLPRLEVRHLCEKPMS